MTNILHLVDSFDYVQGNCFQHQLLHALRKVAPIETCALSALVDGFDREPGPVICCLKQRTLHTHLDKIAKHLKDSPVIIYDQDPWHNFMDDSDYKGVYQRAVQKLNIKKFAVTTKLWADHIAAAGMPSEFVHMWVLPEYCGSAPTYEDRAIQVGFIGSLHPHRRKLFDKLDDMYVQVNVNSNNTLPYPSYLQALSNIRVFIHTEDNGISVDGQPMNLADALWIKDVEAAARGCFTLRNHGNGSNTYYSGIDTTLLYDTVDQIPSILESIEKMDPEFRQDLIDASVDFIKRSDRWQETAKALITF